MKHTFLFQEAVWQAVGRYINQNGSIVEVQGKITIGHGRGLWRAEFLLQLMTDQPGEYRSHEYHTRYQIEAFQADTDSTRWSAKTSAIGNLEGNFVLVDDTILSLFHARVGNGNGMEFFRMIDDTQYQNKGTFFEGNRKISSWTMNLKRQLSAL